MKKINHFTTHHQLVAFALVAVMTFVAILPAPGATLTPKATAFAYRVPAPINLMADWGMREYLGKGTLGPDFIVQKSSDKRGASSPVTSSTRANENSKLGIDGPSLEETLGFIKGKLSANKGSFYTESFSGKSTFDYSWRYDLLPASGSTLEWKETREDKHFYDGSGSYYSETKWEYISVVSMNLRDINPGSITVKDLSTHYKDKNKISGTKFGLEIHTFNENKAIQSRLTYHSRADRNGEVKLDNGEKAEATNVVTIYFSDQETATRCAKAFVHAARLCGAKQEAF